MVRFIFTMTFGDKDHHPDQFWQGLEAAYKIAYGDVAENVMTWEWQQQYALRSYLYPMYLSIPLHVLRFFHIDYAILVVNSMFFMNCLILAVGDLYLFKLAQQMMGRQGATLALLYSFFNWRINEIF